MGVQISLQEIRRREVIQVAAPFSSRDTHCQPRLASGLRAARLIPQFYRDRSLRADGSGKLIGAAGLWRRLVLFVQRLPDNNAFNVLFMRQLGYYCRVCQARYMRNDGQWIGDRSRRVADRHANAFFSRVYRQNAHRSYVLGWF